MFNILYKTIQETTRQIMQESNLEEIIRNKFDELSKTKDFDDIVTDAVKSEIKLCIENAISDSDEIYCLIEGLIKDRVNGIFANLKLEF